MRSQIRAFFAPLTNSNPKILILLIIIIFSLSVSVFAIRQNQDIRRNAQSIGETATIAWGLEPYVWPPRYKTNTQVKILLLPSTQYPVDGFQLVFELDSTDLDLNSIDLNYQPASPSGLTISHHTLTGDSNHYTLTVIATTSDPDTPYIGSGNSIGYLTFNSPSPGHIDIEKDNLLSKVALNPNHSNIYTNSQSLATIEIYSPEPTSTPAPTTFPSPTPTPKPTPSPTPPPGCYYQQVQCFQAPCDPILVCDDEPASTSSPSSIFNRRR